MSAVYNVESVVQLRQWDPLKQYSVEGKLVTYRWAANGVVGQVFVPIDQYNAANVDAAIRQAGYTDEQVTSLGGATAAPAPPPEAA